MSGIVFDFKAIRVRRNALGGNDIIKEYATPESERELTVVEQMRCGALKIGAIMSGESLTETALSDMMRLWREKMAEAYTVPREHIRREPIVGRWSWPVKFVNPLQAALDAAHKAHNPPVLVENIVHGINWLEIGTYGRSPAVGILPGSVNYAYADRPPIREPGFVEDNPCECEDDDPFEPAYEPE